MNAIIVLLSMQAAAAAADGYTSLQYVERSDPITGVKIVLAIAGTARDQVIVVCSPASRTIRVAFTTEQYIPRTGLLTASHKFTYRFDDDKPVTRDWYYDTGKVEEFGSGTTIPFIKRLLTASKIAVRGSSIFGSDPVEAVLPLADARGPVSRVVKACGDTKVSRALSGALD